MSYRPGERIGPYEIVSLLGAGGMGQVYRALDSRLGRAVAIKVLSGDDPSGSARLMHEARATANLRHPNIITVHDVGSSDRGGYIVMELLQGESLAQVLAKEKLSPETTLRYAKQIVSALNKAHEGKLLHRDLKPANIVVEPGGEIKVLDFGLAKHVTGGVTENGCTATLTVTQPNAIAGTLAYMSPEQIRGELLDGRSDQFSFGTVLWEMIEGAHPFVSPTRAETLAAILNMPPREGRGGVGPVNRKLRVIAKRCLAKNKDARYAGMSDVARELEEIGRPAAEIARWAVPILLIFVLAAVVAMFAWFRRGTAEWQVKSTVPLTAYPGDERWPTFSPQGDRVAFAWNGPDRRKFSIYTKLLDSVEPIQVTRSEEDDRSPVWSPDGKWIAFLRGTPEHQGGLYVISSQGGEERKIADVMLPPAFYPGRSLTWTPDGEYLVANVEPRHSLALVSVRTGEIRNLVSNVPNATGTVSPAFSPDGSMLAYTEYLAGPSHVYAVRITSNLTISGSPFQLMGGNQASLSPAWIPGTRELLYLANGTAGRLPAKPGAKPTPIPELGDLIGDIASAKSSDGSILLAVEKRSIDTNVWRADLNVTSRFSPVAVVRSTAGDADAAVHPDGKDLVFVSTRSGRAEIWFSDADGRNARRFLTSGPQGGSLSWSNDGRFLAFDVHSEKGADVYLVGRDGARPRRVDTGHGFSAVPTFSHDSRFLYFTTNINDEFAGARMALNDEGEPTGKAEPLPAPGGGVFRRESPDGKYLVYSKGFSVGALYARELRGGPERKIVDGLVHWSNFAVTNAGVYFVEQPPTGTTSADSNYAASGNSIRFYQFADGKTEVLKVLDAPVSEGFSMDAAGRRLYWSQVDQQNVDLKLSRLSR